MMWRIILLLVVFNFEQAFAYDLRDETAKIYEETGQKLKPEYRQCQRNSECSYAGANCVAYQAVNSASKAYVQKIMVEVAAAKDCLERGKPVPTVKCIQGLCEIVPNHAE